MCVFGGDVVDPSTDISLGFVFGDIDLPGYVARVAGLILEPDVLFHADGDAVLRVLDRSDRNSCVFSHQRSDELPRPLIVLIELLSTSDGFINQKPRRKVQLQYA